MKGEVVSPGKNIVEFAVDGYGDVETGWESHGKCRKVAENYGSGLACARPEERF